MTASPLADLAHHPAPRAVAKRVASGPFYLWAWLDREIDPNAEGPVFTIDRLSLARQARRWTDWPPDIAQALPAFAPHEAPL